MELEELVRNLRKALGLTPSLAWSTVEELLEQCIPEAERQRKALLASTKHYMLVMGTKSEPGGSLRMAAFCNCTGEQLLRTRVVFGTPARQEYERDAQLEFEAHLRLKAVS